MEPSFSTTNSITSHEKEHNQYPTSPNYHQPPLCDHHHQTLMIINSCKETNLSTNCVIISESPLLKNMAHDLQENESEADKLKKHWKEVVSIANGGIAIPETWGKEGLLKDWIDYSTFDALLAPKEVGTAREALVAEARARRRSKGIGELVV